MIKYMITSLLITCVQLANAQQAIVRKNVLGSGGRTVASQQFKLNGTIGQGIVGYTIVKNNITTLNAGFWQPEPSLQITNLIFTSMCSDNPAVSRRWRIRNSNTTSLNVDWEVYGTSQKGTVVAPPGDSFFSTQTVANSPNTTKIYWFNEKGERKSLTKASGGAQCAASSSARVASETQEVFNENPSLHAYPNPGKDQITIEINSEEEIDAPLQIISLTGVLQSETRVRLAKGSNFVVRDISKFAQGTYIIKTNSQSIRFVKD